uniref:ORF49e n=1 Tax=Pinus koraiensis TaxID=88728 RepID=A4QM29_PINKO|nr:ORF49e [Pinus koraiensis]ABP35356.1 ORF49e [Pinus koraiensis]
MEQQVQKLVATPSRDWYDSIQHFGRSGSSGSVVSYLHTSSSFSIEFIVG